MQVSITTFSPASRAFCAACWFTTPSCAHTVLALMAIASSTISLKYSERRKILTISTDPGIGRTLAKVFCGMIEGLEIFD